MFVSLVGGCFQELEWLGQRKKRDALLMGEEVLFHGRRW
jgi:hypothetical protein